MSDRPLDVSDEKVILFISIQSETSTDVDF